ncbi:MAG: XRE family transcriptional regulator [Symploca sp. SIO2G7]|nr:XRE family transcriptional regulator [Symploca sp. SIO2G7]
MPNNQIGFDESLQPRISFSLLFDLLIQIDFKRQVRLAKEALEMHRVVGFLVQGEPETGQEVLVNRLLRLIPRWQNTSPIKVDVTHRAIGRNSRYLLQTLASYFRLPKDAKPNQIKYKICELWQNQNVIFIFDKVDYMSPEVLSAWLQEFWQPLVEMTRINKPQVNTYLLMFLVDYSGSVNEPNLLLAESPNQFEFPNLPLKLPPTARFTLDILNDWIENITYMQIAPAYLTDDLIPEVLLEKTEDGIPELVYEEICNHFGCSWEGDLARWLI